MWLVLSEPGDVSAKWAWEGLKTLAPCPVELLTSDDIEAASQFDHALQSNTGQLDLELSDGRHISSRDIHGVLNRLVSPSRLWLTHADWPDGQYAYEELYAIHASWLSGLTATVINRPCNSGLCGPLLHPSEWMAAARQAGLKLHPFCQSSEISTATATGAGNGDDNGMTVIVLRNRLLGPALPTPARLPTPVRPSTPVSLPTPVRLACKRLARQMKTDLLGITLKPNTRGELTFAGAGPCPELTSWGDRLLRALVEVLSRNESS